MKVKGLMCVCLLSLLAACSDDGNNFPKVVPYPIETPMPEPEPTPGGIEQYTVFISGDYNLNT